MMRSNQEQLACLGKKKNETEKKKTLSPPCGQKGRDNESKWKAECSIDKNIQAKKILHISASNRMSTWKLCNKENPPAKWCYHPMTFLPLLLELGGKFKRQLWGRGIQWKCWLLRPEKFRSYQSLPLQSAWGQHTKYCPPDRPGTEKTNLTFDAV